MVKGKHKGGQPWWRKRRTQRRLAQAASLAVVIVVIGVLAWLVVRGESEGGPREYLREPAPAFALPTIAGEQVSLADHLGRHNLLLYFNEGIG